MRNKKRFAVKSRVKEYDFFDFLPLSLGLVMLSLGVAIYVSGEAAESGWLVALMLFSLCFGAYVVLASVFNRKQALKVMDGVAVECLLILFPVALVLYGLARIVGWLASLFK